MRAKVAEWLEAGTLAVWVVDPRERTVTVHEAGGATTYTEVDRLPGGELLPGFELAVRDLFA